MTWQAFLTLSILLFSLNGLLHRTLMKDEKSDPRAQTIVFGTLVGIFALIIALFRGFHFPQFPLLAPNFLLMIVILTLAPILTFRAYQLSEAAEVGIVMSSQRLWTVMAAFVFLGETATPFKIIGTILILTGVSVVSWKNHRIKITNGILFALLAAFLYGISYVNAFYILQHLDAPSFEVYASLLPALVLLISQPHIISKMNFYLVPKNGTKVLLAAIFDTFATLSLYFAYQIGRNASQIAPLSATSLIFTVIFAALILKEKENLINKLTGSVIVVLGSILILRG